MDKLKYIKLENEDGSYSSSIPLAVDSDHVDVEGSTLTTVLEDKANMANINNLQSEINSLASGSPKGSYATTAALVSANPSTGVYIVQEDGHIYSWTKNGSVPIDLGVYQATDVANNSLYFTKFTNDIFEKGDNLFDYSTCKDKMGITNATGEEVTNNNCFISAFINVEGISKVTVSHPAVKICCWDGNMNYLGHKDLGSSSGYEISTLIEDTAYIKIMFHHSKIPFENRSLINILKWPRYEQNVSAYNLNPDFNKNIHLKDFDYDTLHRIDFLTELPTFESGTIWEKDGTPGIVDSTCRTSKYFFAKAGTTFTCSDDYRMYLFRYDKYYEYIERIPTSWSTSIRLEDDCYCRLIMKKADSSAYTADEINNAINCVTVQYLDLNTLNEKIDSIKSSENDIVLPEFEIGSILGSNGNPFKDHDKICRTKDFFFSYPGVFIETISDDYFIWGFQYNSNTKAFIKRFPSAWTHRIAISTMGWYKIIIKKADFSEWDEEELSNIPNLLSITNTVEQLDIKTNLLESEIEELESKMEVSGNQDLPAEYLFNANITSSYMSDHTFVGDEIWMFEASEDTHTNYATCRRYSMDLENKTLSFLGSFTHNFGHCNTVDYCEENDTLILGNGGGSGNPEPDQIYIIKNASNLKNLQQATLSEVALIIDLDNLGLDWGKQVNVCWGESNKGAFNICYAISNTDNGTNKVIHKLLLGKGSHQLTYGNLSTVSENDFNGTFNILSTNNISYSSVICNQGSQYYKGALYEAIGHDGLWIHKSSMLKDGTIKRENFQNWRWDENGNQISFISEGVAINKNGIMAIGLTIPSRLEFYQL